MHRNVDYFLKIVIRHASTLTTMRHATSTGSLVTPQIIHTRSRFSQPRAVPRTTPTPPQRYAKRVPRPLAAIPDDGIVARPPRQADPSLINDDFTPTTRELRSFGWLDLASLWVGLVVCIPTYMLASGLVEMGFSCTQSIMVIFLSNLITLVPMVLNAVPGTKYGWGTKYVYLPHHSQWSTTQFPLDRVPFPVLARASFGVRGAALPAILRALVACGWFGIQTHVGGAAIHQIISTLSNGACHCANKHPQQHDIIMSSCVCVSFCSTCTSTFISSSTRKRACTQGRSHLAPSLPGSASPGASLPASSPFGLRRSSSCCAASKASALSKSMARRC